MERKGLLQRRPPIMEGPTVRAARYRQEAQALRSMADNEVEGSALKAQLLALAEQYETLAKRAETSVPYS